MNRKSGLPAGYPAEERVLMRKALRLPKRLRRRNVHPFIITLLLFCCTRSEAGTRQGALKLLGTGRQSKRVLVIFPDSRRISAHSYRTLEMIGKRSHGNGGRSEYRVRETKKTNYRIWAHSSLPCLHSGAVLRCDEGPTRYPQMLQARTVRSRDCSVSAYWLSL